MAQTLSLADLGPGQRGYAVTAGPGNALERFDIEILGVQQDVGLGFPLVLVKAGGDFIEASGGVAAGMSGSPVYVTRGDEAALVGAIGYVFPSSDHSLALVTPIEAMRGTPTAALVPFGEDAFARYGVNLDDAVPVTTPLLFSGLSERASTQLEPLFARSSLSPLPVQLGGAGNFDESAYELQPGSAVSVQLVRGDITVAAVGTVTSLEGDSLLAFGHPLLGEGAVSFALAPAFISYIVPSDVVPFKLANNGQGLLGTITQDRPAAIRGEVSREPDFLPVSLTLNGDGKSLGKQFEITNDERYYAPLLAAATLQLFDEARAEVGAGTADLAWDIALADGETVRVLEQVSDPNDIVTAAASLSAGPLGILADNIFEAPELERVSLSITFASEQRFAEIVDVVSDSETLAAGETLTAHLRLQPYRGAPVVKTLVLELPDEAEGQLDIVFRGGLEPGGGEDDEDDPILSFAELLVALRDQVQSSELLVETRIDGERVRLERLSFPYLVQGEETLEISVDVPPDETTDPAPPEDDLVPGDAPDEDELPEPTDPAPPLEPSLGR